MAAGWYLHPLRVRYQETDRMGVVFHGNYVTWFEIGRTEWIRNAGYDYKTIEERGLLLPVVDLQCSYLLPARYDDTVLVCTRIADCSPVKVAFDSQVRRVRESDWHAGTMADGGELPGELLVSGGTKHVWVNEAWQPVRLNKAMPELYERLRTT
ncbi:acyl-CoA thioesterase [Paenibacillus arenilitoris]|uniref:Acyl-CoA thioesterase n=1 Tax=Paenibacillus arenilitoris TaxID=2772299 RepID=A0A927H8D5_9BACL|nr:thioesterase family protein [Paenibacillus arenilitoris]MBD2870514.1 acyl-CoA thioesterase [Paenibacillus arenilitoris]